MVRKSKTRRKIKKRWILLVAAVALLFTMQAMTLLYVANNSNRLALLNQSQERFEREVNDEINNTHREMNSLLDIISSITSQQSDLKEQLGEIKASTSADFSGIIEQVIPGVVSIRTDVSQGSGFFLDDGFIVTNAHVLSGASLANIYTYEGEIYPASLIGYDVEMDLALLRIKEEFAALDIGDSDDVRLGEKVIAIGNPLGLSFTTTEGIISARDREGANNLPYYFQTDVALNPGNSGGPLINTQGEVIGINNFKIVDADNVGFALEINPAIETLNEISQEALNMSVV
ncbi:MAG: S1C family serine protease [Candidatus Nanoarchaeia archaeon]